MPGRVVGKIVGLRTPGKKRYYVFFVLILFLSCWFFQTDLFDLIIRKIKSIISITFKKIVQTPYP